MIDAQVSLEANALPITKMSTKLKIRLRILLEGSLGKEGLGRREGIC